MFEFDSKAPSKDEDTYHFVGYVPVEGRLYELDGLKEGPIDLGAVPADSDWIDAIRPIIEKRIQRCAYRPHLPFGLDLTLIWLGFGVSLATTGTARARSTST